MNYLPCCCIAFYFQDLGSWTVLNDQLVKFHKNNHSDCFQFMLIVNLLANACLRCLNDVSIDVCTLSSLLVILIVTFIYKSTPSYNDYFYTHKFWNNLELCKFWGNIFPNLQQNFLISHIVNFIFDFLQFFIYTRYKFRLIVIK